MPIRCVAAARNLATLILSQDAAFNRHAADRRYTLHGATGELKVVRRGLFFS